MSKDSLILADPPSTGYIASMFIIALAGSLGLPFMVWLIFDGITKHNWVLVAAALVAALICAGMLQSWKSARLALRQRRDGSRYSITISGQKFVYRKDDQVTEIPLDKIMSVEDQVEPSGGSQAWTVRVAFRKADDSQGDLYINKMDFSNTREKQGKFSALLQEAIRDNLN
jgi:hypothetical protein